MSRSNKRIVVSAVAGLTFGFFIAEIVEFRSGMSEKKRRISVSIDESENNAEKSQNIVAVKQPEVKPSAKVAKVAKADKKAVKTPVKPIKNTPAQTQKRELAQQAPEPAEDKPVVSVPNSIAEELNQFNGTWDNFEHEQCSIQSITGLLDLSYKGLEKVKKAVASKKWDQAEKELLAYFKKSRSVEYTIPHKLHPNDKKLAEAALKHRFKGNKTYEPIYRGVQIDWYNNGVLDSGEEVKDAEWLFQFHRFSWWKSMANAYAVNQDDRYFYEWRYELISYLQNVLPVEKKKTPWAICRGMETGGRCAAHISVLPHFIQSEHFDSKLLRHFLYSFHQQSEHIRTVYARKGNHLVYDLMQVFRNGIAFPEFTKSEEWKQDGLERIPKLMFSEMYDDGMNRELIFSYHGMYIGLFGDFYRLLKEHNYEDALPEEYMKRLKRACDVMIYQTFPDWTKCQFGDAWKGGRDNWLFRRWACTLYPEDPHYQFMRSFGRDGKAPEATSIAYPTSGFYFFRSDWTEDAVFMPLKCGEEAEWHNQIDNGTFELYAYGRNFMNDSGCFAYGSSDPEVKRWRDWFRSSKAHQTVTLDNKDISRVPTFKTWNETKKAVSLSVVNESYDDLSHQRTVVFFDNRYFLVYDQLEGDAEGKVRAHFQLNPCESDTRFDDYEIQTTFDSGPNLLVKSFPQQKGMVMEREEGWISYKQKHKEARPAWSYALDKKRSDKKVAFLTALIPQREGESVKRVDAKVKKSGKGLAFELRVDGKRYTEVVN